MKTRNFGLLISSILGISVFSFAPVNAAVLVEPIVTTPNENFPDGETIGDYLPASTGILFGNAPDARNQQNWLNSTGYKIDKLSLFLFPALDFVDEDVIWGDVNGDGKIGLSNIFTNITIAPDLMIGDFVLPRLDLTGGTIPNGNRFTMQFITSPDLTPVDPQEYGPLVRGFSYDGVKSVPEPSNIIGSALVITIGIWLRRSKVKD
ncbi:MAG: PEP-CTERM sorting domain-containing protein [Gloeotrichia echinulata GP01]